MQNKLQILVTYKLGFKGVLMSVAVTLILLGTFCYSLYYMLFCNVSLLETFVIFLIALIILVTINVTILFAPKGCILTKNEIILNRPCKPIRILFKDITIVSTVDETSLKNMIRIFGSGGYWGYWGKFKTPVLGLFYMHTKTLKSLIFVRCKNGKQYVFQGGGNAGYNNEILDWINSMGRI